MKHLFIITVATDVYKAYLKNLCYSLKNIIPMKMLGYDLHFLLLTDDDNALQDVMKYDEFDYLVHHIVNLPYPWNTGFKFHVMDDCIKRMKLDPDAHFIFVDVDSLFRKMNEHFYERLDSLLDEDVARFAWHPWRIYDPGKFNYEQTNNSKSCTYIEPSKYVNERFVQASFMMGSLKHIDELVTKLDVWFRKMYAERRIPYLGEQSIINKILSEDLTYAKVDPYIFSHYKIAMDNTQTFVDNFQNGLSSCNDTFFINNYQNMFVFQKYDATMKTKRIS